MFVVPSGSEGITEGCYCIREIDPVLSEIRTGLHEIPLVLHTGSICIHVHRSKAHRTDGLTRGGKRLAGQPAGWPQVRMTAVLAAWTFFAGISVRARMAEGAAALLAENNSRHQFKSGDAKKAKSGCELAPQCYVRADILAWT